MKAKFLHIYSRMARLSWYYSPLILIVFFLQLFLLQQRAQHISYDGSDESPAKSSLNISIPVDHLLSSAPVPATIQEIRTKIRVLNDLQLIFNGETHGGFSVAPETPVFIVQLHDRIPYIQAIIQSLRAVRGINQSLIIFSHDVFSKEINDVIQGMQFARVMQIYYPYSIQMYPNGYPGPDPKDAALPIGHGRKPQLAQIKLHWIWKFTQVFRHIKVLRNHTGPKIFLEEDHYVSPDIIYTLNKTLQIQTKDCPKCVIILGDYPKEHRWPYLDWDQMEWSWFFSGGNNMGMVLNQRFAGVLSQCAKRFCTIDEYNWDWTLQHLNVGCFQERLQILKVEAPRVWHVGDCGTHTSRDSKKKCGTLQQVDTLENVKRLLRNKTDVMFPKEMRVVKKLRRNVPSSPSPYGGWADPRDHSLCLSVIKDL
ncbi:alpha-1,6-mannosyl-glycoprotein 2-beta-N-acetylglucosaminyltransferase-like [Paramacrobiotus metropolitanus]|uniref:alpha-1,6-mannosyl-glycoprotein 2-beta-N-acetylglucosaminyltransferase-like n=1 Tax=Paramacrobiotus metropolitanus TaxID=2943436 RepID=UPI002445BE7B|nr:alpha-1,6-mannosyl-glycoprotein 2-beta-N-acetylglucosaminyltransferase-like [Paramacrobiotus metropolitanus]